MSVKKNSKVVSINGRALSWDEFVGEVRTLLKAASNVRQIERDSQLTYRWLIEFKRGTYRDVTADNVIRLAQALGLRFRINVDIPSAAPEPARAATTIVVSPKR